MYTHITYLKKKVSLFSWETSGDVWISSTGQAWQNWLPALRLITRGYSSLAGGQVRHEPVLHSGFSQRAEELITVELTMNSTGVSPAMTCILVIATWFQWQKILYPFPTFQDWHPEILDRKNVPGNFKSFIPFPFLKPEFFSFIHCIQRGFVEEMSISPLQLSFSLIKQPFLCREQMHLLIKTTGKKCGEMFQFPDFSWKYVFLWESFLWGAKIS